MVDDIGTLREDHEQHTPKNDEYLLVLLQAIKKRKEAIQEIYSPLQETTIEEEKNYLETHN